VQQVIGADSPRIHVRLLPEEICHRLSELPVVGYARRTPRAVTSQRSPLPPSPHDDHEIMSAQDRAAMLAAAADAPS
jgi:hypothetical protein